MESPCLDPSLNKIDQARALQLGLKLTTIDLVGGIYCHICRLTFGNKKAYEGHYAKHNTGSSAIIYTCVMCHKEITGYASFRGHCYSAHVIKDKFKCEHCDKLFKKQSYLKDHINAIHTFICPMCNKEFPTKKDFQLHKMLHRSDRPPYDCQDCHEKIENMDTCELHISKHSTFIYKCPICEEIITKENATQHLTTHFGEVLNDNADDYEVPEIPEDSSIHIIGGIYCYVCDNIFKNRNEFDSHFSAEHVGESLMYSCIICKKKFLQYWAFGDHCYSHLVRDRFRCDICSKPFSRLSRLILHTGAHAFTSGESPFVCVAPACQRRFAGEPRLRAHLRNEHGLTHLRCTHNGCKEIFERPKDLILHQKCHNLISDNWCRQCGLLFTTLIACEKHLDVHKMKSYSCPVCDKKYNEKYLLMKHIPEHFEMVFHMCKVCGKVYNVKRRLVEHSKTHANVKSHICTICGKGFAKTTGLQEHLNLHKDAKQYGCIICPKSFSNHSNWCKHLRNVHKVDPKNVKHKLKDCIKENKSNDSDNSTAKTNILGPQQFQNDIENKKEAMETTNTDVSSCSENQDDNRARVSLHDGNIDDNYGNHDADNLAAKINDSRCRNSVSQTHNKNETIKITDNDLNLCPKSQEKSRAFSSNHNIDDHSKKYDGDNLVEKTNESNLQSPKKKLKNRNEFMEITNAGINACPKIQEKNYMFASLHNDDMELNRIDPNEIEQISEGSIDSVITDNVNVEFTNNLPVHDQEIPMIEHEPTIDSQNNEYATSLIIKKKLEIENNINPIIVNESVAEFTRALNEEELQIIEESIKSVEANAADMLPVNTKDLQILEQSINTSVIASSNNEMQYAVNNTIIVPETIVQSTLLHQPMIPNSVAQINEFPRDIDSGLGPELINTDDHILPHIDPFLTIKTKHQPHHTSRIVGNFNETEQNIAETEAEISKLYPNYSYSYSDINDIGTNRFSFVNTDIY